MRQWSFSLGRLFGVEVRVHLLFALLFAAAAFWAVSLGRPPARGLLLCGLLVMAVLVRELARGLAAAWCGVPARGVLLLPTGGLLETADGAGRAGPRERRVLAWAGPVASLVFGLMLAGAILAVAPGVDLMGQPWVTPLHLLRSAVWLNLLMGAVNLLPAWPLDGGRTAEGGSEMGPEDRIASGGAAAISGMGHTAGRRLMGLLAAVAVIVFGIVNSNWWVLAGGMTVLLFAQAQRQGLLPGGSTQGVTVGEVMLTDFVVLSASATLEDALAQARHSLQDWFPVVRGQAVVGAISRQAALAAVESGGNGYVQGSMLRKFETALSSEPLGKALLRVARSAAEEVSSLVPVLENERIVGLLTPEHLQRALVLVHRERARRAAQRLVEDR